MRAAGVLAGLVLALLLQTTIAGMTMAGGALVNLVLVVVVFVALAYGAVAGLIAGMAGGLVQDALAGGIIGIGSLSKSVAGFLVGVLGAQFIVSQPLPRFVMFLGATAVHELCYQGLFALIEFRPFSLQYSTLAVQALINGVVGILAFQVVEGAPGLVERRRMRRASIRRRF
ncbi:MAG: rod shape-determining protein MreD [Acidobacteria bacterium]|nr:rod shape-determining protein MreD [Acidobacteriota bacterium]MBA3888145.1 rod shape-determining protein MreD [Acidobacteriota bacterium]